MTVRHAPARGIGKWLERLLLGGVLLSILLLLVVRFGWPQLAEYRGEIEAGLSHYLRRPVRIEQLSLGWQGWQPVLRVQGFSLQDTTNNLPLVRFQRAVIHLRLLRSLYALRPEPYSVRLEGGYASLTYNAAGALSLTPSSVRGRAPALEELLAWLVGIESLDLHIDELRLPPFKDRPPWVLHDLRLSLRHQPETRLGVSVELPASLGRQLHLVVALSGNDPNAPAQSGHFYARGMDLQPAGWPLPVTFTQGRVDTLELWGAWHDLTMTRLQGQFQGGGLALIPPAAESVPAFFAPDAATLTTRFDWRRRPEGWNAEVGWQGSDAQGSPIFNSAMGLAWANPQADRPGRLAGNVNDLRLQDLLAGVGPWLTASQRRGLEQLSPHALFPRVEGWFEPHATQTGPNYRLIAEFNDLRTQEWQTVPAIGDLAGRIELDGDHGVLTLDNTAPTLTSRQWRTPLKLEQLGGAVHWRSEDGGWRVATTGLQFGNTVFNATLRGDVNLPLQDSPRLDTQLDFEVADIARLKDYLPAKLLHPRLVDWLRQALVGGRLTAGQSTLQGRLSDFPFSDSPGLFETRFQLHDATLDYSQRWPRLEELEAAFTFRNQAMDVAVQAGTMLGADVEKTTCRIADLRQAILNIEGRIRASSATLLRFLKDSPLTKRAGPHVAKLQARGENTLDLVLAIPLNKQPSRVKGVVGFTGGEISVPGFGLTLGDIRGDLAFDGGSLNARDIKLLFRGEPATLDVNTESGSIGQTIHFKLSGIWDLSELVGSNALRSYLQGKGPVAIDLQVPSGGGDTSSTLALAASTDLQGIAVNLPSPLGKPSTGKRLLTIKIDLDDDDKKALQILIDYEPDTQAILEWGGFPRQARFLRGAVHIDAGRAKLPEAPGLTLIANLPYWRLSIPGPGEGGGASIWQNLNDITAHIDKLQWGDWIMDDLSLHATPDQNAVHVDLTGTAANGRLALPIQSGTPLQVELRHLVLSHPTATPTSAEKPANTPAAKTEEPDPRRLPPLRIVIEDLILDGHTLGRLKLLTDPRNDGMSLTELQLHSNVHEVSASGDWSVTPEGPLSRIQVGFNSKDLGASLQSLGYAATIQGGETRADFTASWRAPLPAVTLALLNGHLDFTVGAGQLLKVDLGVGRIFGLLNFSNIMRRLRLDFSDLLEEGLTFDSITGSFDFDQGQANTDNFVMEGPAIRIGITGRIDLLKRRYDQLVTVIPQVGSPLTIAGTIAGGPVVGAAVFVAENLLKPGIDEVARRQYRLSGSWDDPSFQAVGRESLRTTPQGGHGNK
ncbi:MAG: TIGR02099 family protein [Gammaproteobacteria bacterium]|nr:TIGR02099 family protein [Gammaproteobacteria bacterium]